MAGEKDYLVKVTRTTEEAAFVRVRAASATDALKEVQHQIDVDDILVGESEWRWTGKSYVYRMDRRATIER